MTWDDDFLLVSQHKNLNLRILVSILYTNMV